MQVVAFVGAAGGVLALAKPGARPEVPQGNGADPGGGNSLASSSSPRRDVLWGEAKSVEHQLADVVEQTLTREAVASPR